MNKYMCVVLVPILFLGLTSCSNDKKIETEVQSEEVSTQEDKTMALCKACGMEMPVNVMITHEIDGEKGYFCNEFCRDHYLAATKEGKKEE